MRHLIEIQIAIVSPGDVSEWRDFIENYVNEVYQTPKNVLVKIVRWENDMPSTSGRRPQDLINETLIDTSDILLGMFGSRFGTPTENANSGTQEEIERKLNNDEPVILYFYQGQKLKDVSSQYMDVINFKNKYQNQGSYFEFEKKEELEKHLRLDLDYNINLVLERLESNTKLQDKQQEIDTIYDDKLWYDNSITDLMNSYMLQRGFEAIFHKNKVFKYDVKLSNLPPEADVDEARRYAFNEKYGNYDYNKDLRSYYDNCYSQIRNLILEKSVDGILKKSVIGVASNYGVELKKIFQNEDSVHLTVLDISDKAIKRGKKLYNDIDFINGNMEKPIAINKLFDIYLNLRGIQSNGVSVPDTIIQSYKKLKINGIAIFSISNGYLIEREDGEFEVIEGMYDHTVKTFTEDRPMKLAEKVYRKMKSVGYKNCGIHSIDTEILVYGIKRGENYSNIVK